MTQLLFPSPEGFTITAAASFYAGFTPGSGMAAAAVADNELTLTFGLDGSYAPVAVTLRQTGDAIVAHAAGITTAADRAALRAQIARMLGLDADAAAWRELGVREPLVGALQREFPGFLTAAKASPYDAATWAVIAPRTSMAHAAQCKRALAAAFGDTVLLEGRAHTIFPSPAVLATIDHFPGLPEEKMVRLRGVAQAALDGRLDAERLRRMGETAALAELQTLRGIGPWAASHIYFRGAAPHDGLPATEPRLLHGLAHASGLAGTPDIAAFAQAAERWRPFRMWVAVLLMRSLARTERWHAPELRRERAHAGRRAATRPTAVVDGRRAR